MPVYLFMSILNMFEIKWWMKYRPEKQTRWLTQSFRKRFAYNNPWLKMSKKFQTSENPNVRSFKQQLCVIFIKCCTNSDLDSKINWLDFEGLQPHVLWLRHLYNASQEFVQIWFTGPFRLEDELMTFWRSKVKFTLTSNCVRTIF